MCGCRRTATPGQPPSDRRSPRPCSPSGTRSPASARRADLSRLNRLATTLVQRLLEAAHRRAENRVSRYALTGLETSGIPERYFTEITHGD